MNHDTRVGSVMTPFPHAIDLEAPLAEARRKMTREQIRHLPVKRGDDLVGLLTDRTIKLVLGPYLDDPEREDHPRVRDACLFDLYTVEMTTPLGQVAAEMGRRRLGSALVTKAGRLAGIFTANDACRILAELLDHQPSPSDDEAA